MSLTSIEFHKITEEKTISKYKEDLGFFIKLRSAVLQRFSDAIDYKQYEGQIQKLIDTHIQTSEVRTVTELVNIFDKEKFQQEVEKTTGEAAKADKIASRTAKHITEKMVEDPAFYKKFSEMLKDTIKAYEEQRISESQYLNKVKDIMDSVLSRTDSDIPAVLENRDVAKAFYGITKEALTGKLKDEEVLKTICADIAIASDDIILKLKKVDWEKPGSDVPKKMIHLIGDYMIDDVRDKYDVKLNYDEIDNIAERFVDVAKIRYK